MKRLSKEQIMARVTKIEDEKNKMNKVVAATGIVSGLVVGLYVFLKGMDYVLCSDWVVAYAENNDGLRLVLVFGILVLIVATWLDCVSKW